MAVAGGVQCVPSKFRRPPTTMIAKSNRNRTVRPPPPIFISTNPSHVNPQRLRELYSLCNHSCHRFPNLDSGGRVEPVDLDKLRIALSHSSVVVSVFSKPEVVSYYSSFSSFPNSSSSQFSNLMGVGGDWFRRVVPVTPSNGQLVGFGRAVSDYGLTASIYDVMCLPASVNCLKMGKIWVEVCLISAQGLRRTSLLFKLQWYAVAWIHPNNKYCSRVDSSGNANPVWKTKFSALVDSSELNFQDLALHVEVYSRELIFLGERLQGTATVVLKEFLDKYTKNSEVSKPVEEVGSFQLRKRNSSKPQGFVDISIRISEEREEHSSYTGKDGGFKLMDHNNGINLANEYGLPQAHLPQFPLPTLHRPENRPPTNSAYAHPVPLPTAYSNSSAGGPNYQPRPTPPPPPPPSNVGYISTFLPRTDHLPPNYINMQSARAAPGRGGGAGFGMGMGAGALAAGAVIFGDDFMSGFDVPAGLQDASVTMATDPPF